jgi:KaiC/GvpD/RAD55 family RecA-like ATPase
MSVSKEISLLRDFKEEADKLRDSYGRTELYSTGAQGLDSYIGQGFGRQDGYEIVLLFGPTGIGKSLVGLNFLRAAVEQGKKVGIMALEDDGPDVYLRFCDMLGPEAVAAYVSKGETVFTMPPSAMTKSWKLDELIELIESWFTQLGIDVILLDHLQFAFENSEMLRGENEYIMQRVFMQKLNHLMKRMKKTIILISHINKDTKAKGLYKIVGSSGIAQAATKALELSKEDGKYFIMMWKSRFTRTPDEPFEIMFEGTSVRDAQYGVQFE